MFLANSETPEADENKRFSSSGGIKSAPLASEAGSAVDMSIIKESPLSAYMKPHSNSLHTSARGCPDEKILAEMGEGAPPSPSTSLQTTKVDEASSLMSPDANNTSKDVTDELSLLLQLHAPSSSDLPPTTPTSASKISASLVPDGVIVRNDYSIKGVNQGG